MPELPEARRRRFVAQYAIPDYDAGVLTQSAGAGRLLRGGGAAAGNAEGRQQLGHGRAAADDEGARPRRWRRCRFGPSALAGLIALIDKGTISSSIAKDVFAKMYDSGRSADEIVAAEGLAQIGDEAALLDIVRGVMAANADAVAQYRAGKTQTFGFLVGQVMKGSGGKANPKLAKRSAEAELELVRG